MVRLAFLLLSVVSSVFFAGCALFFNEPDHRSRRYQVVAPKMPWEEVNRGTADRVFIEPTDRTSISLSSVCDENTALSLEDLTRNLLTQIGERTQLKQERIRIDNNPALYTQVEGKMDGTPYWLDLVVVRTSRDCVYDFSLVTSTPDIEKHRSVYRDFLANFAEEVKK